MIDYKTVSKHFSSDSEKSFFQRIYSDGIIKYKRRLQAIGFSGEEMVLDAGCGYGQWSLALSELNKNVESLDFSKKRIKYVKK